MTDVLLGTSFLFRQAGDRPSEASLSAARLNADAFLRQILRFQTEVARPLRSLLIPLEFNQVTSRAFQIHLLALHGSSAIDDFWFHVYMFAKFGRYRFRDPIKLLQAHIKSE